METDPEKTKETKKILLVIPCYKEGSRLPEFLNGLCETFKDSDIPLSIMTVDDGSGPQEAALMTSLIGKLQKEYNFLLDPILLKTNQGKGGAIYSGWDYANEDTFNWIAFVDADGAISPSETLRFLKGATSDNAEKKICLWSVRVNEEGKSIKRTAIRNLLGNVFRIIVKCVFFIPVKDTQCGMKCIPLKAYREICNRLTERRFVFDVELAALLTRKGYALKQIPIDWQESPGSTVKLSSAIRMLISLFIIRIKLLFNR